MKPLSKIILFLFLFSISASAQVYVFLSGGYNADAGGISIMGNHTSVSQSIHGVRDYTDTFEKIDASFGKGGVIAGGCGLHLNEYISMEIAAEKIIGDQYVGTSVDRTYIDGTLSGNYESTTTWNFKSLNVLPSLVVRLSSGAMSPFIRLGGMLSFPDIDYQYRSSSGLSFKHVFSGGIGYGMTGALGATARMAGGSELWMVFHFASASWSPTRDEYTDYDGVTRNIELKDAYTETYRYVNSERVPEQRYDMAPTIPMGYIGMSAGIRVVIGSSEPDLPE